MSSGLNPHWHSKRWPAEGGQPASGMTIRAEAASRGSSHVIIFCLVKKLPGETKQYRKVEAWINTFFVNLIFARYFFLLSMWQNSA